MPKCELLIKSVYGRPVLYPANDVAQRFAAMLGTKTLTRRACEAIEGLGFSVEALGVVHSWREAL